MPEEAAAVPALEGVNPAAVTQIVELLGVSTTQASQALEACGGRLPGAVELLLDRG